MIPRIKSALLILPSGLGDLIFHQAKLRFDKRLKINLFTKRVRKTLDEMIFDLKYEHLMHEVHNNYQRWLDAPLGLALGKLKERGDPFYKRFLNEYGDLTFCKFKMIDPFYINKRGLFVFVVRGEVLYIGRCHEPYHKRINTDYGAIFPQKCFIDGQANNCRFNALITAVQTDIRFYLMPLEDDEQMILYERQLIEDYAPAWNFSVTAAEQSDNF